VLASDAKITAADIITDDSLHLMAGPQASMAGSSMSKVNAMAARN
jgi:hypothetical protein